MRAKAWRSATSLIEPRTNTFFLFAIIEVKRKSIAERSHMFAGKMCQVISCTVLRSLLRARNTVFAPRSFVTIFIHDKWRHSIEERYKLAFYSGDYSLIITPTRMRSRCRPIWALFQYSRLQSTQNSPFCHLFRSFRLKNKSIVFW